MEASRTALDDGPPAPRMFFAASRVLPPGTSGGSGLLGSFLAWFNVAIMFPREVSGGLSGSAEGAAGGDRA
jgi:hypothetical protein